MFHVEHTMKILILFISASFFLLGCNQPDSHPELKDPIYADINASLGSVSQDLDAELKTLEEHEQALKDIVPQTGQIKFAEKRVFESKARLNRLEQEKKYLELKLEARRKEARTSYLSAFNKKETWPPPEEWSQYLAEKNLRNAKRAWDVKERMEKANLSGSVADAEPSPGH